MINELPNHKYRGIGYMRISDMSDEGMSVQFETWMEGRWRLSVPELEVQDAVFWWQHTMWTVEIVRALDPNINVYDYTSKEIEVAKLTRLDVGKDYLACLDEYPEMGGQEGPDMRWQSYLPFARTVIQEIEAAQRE